MEDIIHHFISYQNDRNILQKTANNLNQLQIAIAIYVFYSIKHQKVQNMLVKTANFDRILLNMIQNIVLYSLVTYPCLEKSYTNIYRKNLFKTLLKHVKIRQKPWTEPDFC